MTGSVENPEPCQGQRDFSDEWGQGTNLCGCREFREGAAPGWCRCGHNRATHRAPDPAGRDA